MFQVFGYAIGIYLLYAILALLFRHTGGFVLAITVAILLGICNIIFNFDFLPIVSGMVFFLLVCWVPSLHIRDDKKVQREEKSKNEIKISDDTKVNINKNKKNK